LKKAFSKTYSSGDLLLPAIGLAALTIVLAGIGAHTAYYTSKNKFFGLHPEESPPSSSFYQGTLSSNKAHALEGKMFWVERITEDLSRMSPHEILTTHVFTYKEAALLFLITVPITALAVLGSITAFHIFYKDVYIPTFKITRSSEERLRERERGGNVYFSHERKHMDKAFPPPSTYNDNPIIYTENYKRR
jgi:hypothetical protein